MQSLTLSAAIDGPEPQIITVECSYTSGFAGLQIIGSNSELCRDGKERAKTALEHLGLRLGHKRIVINLAPASVRKEGNHFDLPMAVSLASLLRNETGIHNPAEWLFAAELGLDGTLRPCRSLVPMALCAIGSGLKGMILAQDQAKDGSVLENLPHLQDRLRLLFFKDLRGVLQWLFEGITPDTQIFTPVVEKRLSLRPNFDDMYLSRELETLALVCTLGRHSLLLRGTPGTGKSMFAHRLPSLLPTLARDMHLEIMQIYSRVHEVLPADILAAEPPFRHPHHSSSPQALLGTGCEPGELTLAHGGMLFLDELPEFRRDLLESLREPLELGQVHISRAQKKMRWPASVQFIAACNNCGCGWFASKKRVCRCGTRKLLHYWSKLSGPILDRIDIHYNMPESTSIGHPNYSLANRQAPMTLKLRQRWQQVEEWRTLHRRELSEIPNAALSYDQLIEVSGCSTPDFSKLLHTLESMHLSRRSIIRTMRVSRTLADLDQSLEIQDKHIQQAARWQHSPAARERGESLIGESHD